MVIIEFDHGKRFRTGEKGVLGFRLVPHALGAEEVSLCLRWRDDGVEKRTRVTGLQPGSPRHVGITWIPQMGGEDVIVVEGEIRDARRCIATFQTQVHVQIASAVVAPASLHISNTIQGHVVKVMGNDMSARVDLPRGPAPIEYYPDWRALDLFLTRRQVARLIDHVAPNTNAVLQWRGPAGEGRCHIASGLELRCGRHSANDVLLRFLPESPEHEQSSERLSRSQFIVTAAGGQVAVRHGGGSSPTTVDGRKLDPGRELAIGVSGARMTAGIGGLDLALDVLDDVDVQTIATWSDVADLIGAPATIDGPSAVRIRRLNNAPEVSHLWLRRWATVGGSPHCAIHVPGLQPAVAARLFFVAGRYFLQPWAEGDPVMADEVALDAGSVCQLPGTASFRVGGVSFEWSLGA